MNYQPGGVAPQYRPGPQNNGGYGSITRRQINVSQLLLVETGTYNEQFRRPYETHLRGDTMNRMQNRVAASTPGAVTSTAIGSLAAEFVMPAAAPESRIDIVNGWDTRRMRFNMTVVIQTALGFKTSLILAGYTDHYGAVVAPTRHTLDPNMRFIINSILRVREVTERTPMGTMVNRSVIENSHLLSDMNYSGFMQPNRETRMRPEDVFTTMSLGVMAPVVGGGRVFDTRALNNGQTAKSSRSNNLSTSYATRIINGYAQAVITNDNDTHGSQEFTSILDKARSYVADSDPGEDEFLMALSQIRGNVVGNEFTWAELQRLDPNVDSVTVLQQAGEAYRQDYHVAGQTAYWNAADLETQRAHAITQEVCALMMEVAIPRMNFTVNNMGHLGQPTFTPVDVQGFVKADFSTLLQAFEVRLVHEVLNPMSMNNQLTYSIIAEMDVMGESRVQLSIDNGPFIPYVTPSFSDALLVPVVTANQHTAQRLSSDFQQLTNHLTQARSGIEYDTGSVNFNKL